jgi:hypothetical protein
VSPTSVLRVMSRSIERLPLQPDRSGKEVPLSIDSVASPAAGAQPTDKARQLTLAKSSSRSRPGREHHHRPSRSAGGDGPDLERTASRALRIQSFPTRRGACRISPLVAAAGPAPLVSCACCAAGQYQGFDRRTEGLADGTLPQHLRRKFGRARTCRACPGAVLTDLEGLRVINQDGIDFGVVDHPSTMAHPVMLLFAERAADSLSWAIL